MLSDELKFEIEREIALQLGNAPSIDVLRSRGYKKHSKFITLANKISEASTIFLIASKQIVYSISIILLTIFFATIEGWRIFLGLTAIGQPPIASSGVAFVIMVYNIVHPMTIASKKIEGDYVIQQIPNFWDYIGNIVNFFDWRDDKKRKEKRVSIYHTKQASVVSKIFLFVAMLFAILDLAHPILMLASEDGTVWREGFSIVYNQTTLIQLIEIIAMFLLSIGAVLGLQSTSYLWGAMGNRELQEDLLDVFEQELSVYNIEKERITKEILERSKKEEENFIELDGILIERGIRNHNGWYSYMLPNGEILRFKRPSSLKKKVTERLWEMYDNALITEEIYQLFLGDFNE